MSNQCPIYGSPIDDFTYMNVVRAISRGYTLRRLLNVRLRRGRGYHEIVKRRRAKQLRRGRIRRTCLKLAYQIPLAILAALGIVVIIMHSGDRRLFTKVEIASAGSGYNLTSFEARHLPAKWIHRIYSALPWTDIDENTRRAHLDRFQNLARELRSARNDLKSALARGDALAVSVAQSHVTSLLQERNAIRDAAEELLESAISTELTALGLNKNGDFIWPPVDLRIDDTPHVLVTSPRDVIQRDSVRILKPDLTEDVKERMETQIFDTADLSAVVLPTGGLASFPNLVPSDYSLQALLEVSAHEWLHAYLIFHPLGRSYWSGGDMTSLNETLANLVGKEIGRTVYNQITGENVETLEPPYMPEHVQEDPDTPSKFDVQEFLHETRHRTDELLERGEIEEAEAYMESRRLELVENGHNIRKLNQAYFAFHGLYADGPSSTSPLARQIWELRQQSTHAGDLVKTLQTISNYEEFLALLDERSIARE